MFDWKRHKSFQTLVRMAPRSAVLASLLLSACGGAEVPTPTPTLVAVTATAAATAIPTPTVIEETPAATPTPAPPKVLPSSLYYLSPTDSVKQIWRIDRDGKTATQITHEPTGVNDFDISPADGTLVYVSDNTLIASNPMGDERKELVKGNQLPPTPDDNTFYEAIQTPRWSPDGTQIAYGLNGINLIGPQGGEPKVLKQNDPKPEPGKVARRPIMMFRPVKWSPDGQKMVIFIAYWGSEGGEAIMNVADGSLGTLSGADAPGCCNPAWSPDSRYLYFASPTPGMYEPGLWRIDATTQKAQTLLKPSSDSDFPLVGFVHPINDMLYYFYAHKTVISETNNAKLTLYRAEAQNISAAQALREDSYALADALWSADGAGAVIIELKEQAMTAYPFVGPLLYLKSDGSPAVALGGQPGHTLRWGP